MEDSIFDEKEELMVSPLGGIPTQRKPNFLKPIVSSFEGPNLKLPSLLFSSESECPLQVSFNGFRHHQNKWKKWVEAMESVHHSVWKVASIYEAIMGLVYKVHTDEDLIFDLVERWCCENKTFVFPLGEASITHVAINLARGMRLALASAIFASIYRDLSLLKQTMIMASSDEPGSNGDSGDTFNILEFSLWAQLQFVQVWAWERLLPLRPKQPQNCNMVRGVRIGRWHDMKQLDVINVRTTIDSSGEIFQWRSYTLALEGWLVPKFYKEKEEWTVVEGTKGSTDAVFRSMLEVV